MAAFTAALIGLALAGGLAAGTQLGKKNDGTPQPDQKLGGPQPTPPVAPPSLALTNAAASTAAAQAAQKQRKKALSAGTLTNGAGSTQTPAAPMLQPRTLLGY